jgi:hypothetical protein
MSQAPGDASTRQFHLEASGRDTEYRDWLVRQRWIGDRGLDGTHIAFAAAGLASAEGYLSASSDFHRFWCCGGAKTLAGN